MPHSVFDLPEHLAAKTDPALVAADESHFAAIAHAISQSTSELVTRLDAARRAPGGVGQEAMDRDLEVHRLTARLRLLRRFGRDLCLGRMVSAADGGEPVYVGRLGLTDSGGRRLLIDWRSPAAEPFFAATHAHPMGLASRRRYRWTRGLITDFWDEVYASAPGSDEELGQRAALDDQSAFIASLGSTRSPRMRDVLGTIQADQDAIIRAGSTGALVVDGGPGTGKTVVALHRAAYLLYSDPRLGHHRGGVLFVGPHQPYLAYVADVWLSPADGAEAFGAPDPGTPHNPAREQVWGALVTILLDRHDDDVPADLLRRSLAQDEDLVGTFDRCWPLLEPTGDGSATRGPRSAGGVGRRLPPPSASGAPTSSPISSRPTTPRCSRCPCCGTRTCAPTSMSRTAHRAPTGICWPVRSPTSWWTRRRTSPVEVMAEAEPVIRSVLPDANVPVSVRASGLPVVHAATSDLTRVLDGWLATHPEGVACVIGDRTFEEVPRVRSLSPETAKGLEFDLVVLVDPAAFGTGTGGAVDRYVAMTRATQQLVVLTGGGADQAEGVGRLGWQT